MNNSVSSNKRFRNSLTISFRQYFIRLFLLISSNPADATALLTVPASPGWQHVLSWVKFCTTCLNCSPALFPQLCRNPFRHRDIPSTSPMNTELPLVPRAVLRLSPDAASSRSSNFIPPHRSRTRASPPWQIAQRKPNFLNHTLCAYPSGTRAAPVVFFHAGASAESRCPRPVRLRTAPASAQPCFPFPRCLANKA